MQNHLLDIDTALLTQRTVVRRFREGEGKAFYEAIDTNRTRLTDHLPLLVQMVKDEFEAEFFVRRALADWLLQKAYAFGIWEHKTAGLVGFIRLKNLNWELAYAEIDFFIDHDFSAKGLMTEVLLALLRFAFKELKLEKVAIKTEVDNYAAQRLARKCGFQREGDLRMAWRTPAGTWTDLMLLGLTRAEFDKV